MTSKTLSSARESVRIAPNDGSARLRLLQIAQRIGAFPTWPTRETPGAALTGWADAEILRVDGQAFHRQSSAPVCLHLPELLHRGSSSRAWLVPGPWPASWILEEVVNHDVLPRYLGKATDQGPRSEEPAARLSWDTARELATILTRALRDTAGLPENWKLELPTDEFWVQAAARYPDFLPVRTFLPVPSMLWSRNEDGSNQSGFKGPGLEWCLDEGPLRSTLLTRVARGGKSFQGGATVGGTALDPSNGHSDTFVRLVLHGLAP